MLDKNDLSHPFQNRMASRCSRRDLLRQAEPLALVHFAAGMVALATSFNQGNIVSNSFELLTWNVANWNRVGPIPQTPYDMLQRKSPRIETSETIGDASRIYRVKTEEADAPAVALDLDFRTGNVMAGVGVRIDVAAYRTAFPDLAVTVDDLFAGGDRIVRRYTLRGTHTRPFLGVPASSGPVVLRAIAIDRLVQGKLVESWVQGDQLQAPANTRRDGASQQGVPSRKQSHMPRFQISATPCSRNYVSRIRILTSDRSAPPRQTMTKPGRDGQPGEISGHYLV